MDAHICFKPGICSDDGRAMTGWYDVYTRRSGAYPGEFWNEPKFCATKEEAEKLCKDKGWNVVNRQGM